MNKKVKTIRTVSQYIIGCTSDNYTRFFRSYFSYNICLQFIKFVSTHQRLIIHIDRVIHQSTQQFIRGFFVRFFKQSAIDSRFFCANSTKIYHNILFETMRQVVCLFLSRFSTALSTNGYNDFSSAFVIIIFLFKFVQLS